jgi:hypothetical protein
MRTGFKAGSPLEEAKAIALKDRERLNRALNVIKTETTAEALRRAFGGRSSEQVQQTVRKVRYDHGAILLATEPSLVDYWLAQEQFGSASLFPSSIVARRLEKRYGVPSPTTILRANITIPDPDRRSETVKRQVEVFLPAAAAQTWDRRALEAEQTHNYESHTAFVVHEGFTLKEVRADFLINGLQPDGGGTNTVENSTTLYFINERGERFELIQYGKTENELGVAEPVFCLLQK